MLPDEYRDCSDFPNAHSTSPEKGKLGWGPRALLRVSSMPLNSMTLYIVSTIWLSRWFSLRTYTP